MSNPSLDEFTALAAPIDADGDGRQDLLLPIQEANNTEITWTILHSYGDGTFVAIPAGIPFDNALTANGITLANRFGPRVTDVDGDGGHDVVLLHNGAFKTYKNNLGEEDLLAGVTDGLNGHDPGDPSFLPNVQIAYGHLADLAITAGLDADSAEAEAKTYLSRFDPENDCAYPRRCVVGPRRVVRGYSLNNGNDQPRSYEVAYRDGRYHRLGRGFLGFGARIVRDLDTGAGTAELYDNITHDPVFDAFPYAGQVTREWRWNPGLPGQPNPSLIELSYSSASFERVVTNGGATYFTLPLVQTTRREQGIFLPDPMGPTTEQYVRDTESVGAFLLGASTRSIAAYDDYGNILLEGTFATGADLGAQIQRTFSNDEKGWRIGQLDEEVECSDASPGGVPLEQCRTTARTYDANGQVHVETLGTKGDPETTVTLVYTRDVFGNVIEASAEDAYGFVRRSCTSYDDEGVYPYAHRNPAGHLSYTKFDRGLGVPTAAIDPNGFVVQWAHDGFGRATEEHPSNAPKTTFALTRTKDGGPSQDAWNLKLETKTPGLRDDTVEYDSLGRAVRWWTQNANTSGPCKPSCPPTPRIVQEIAFDALGEHVARRSVPTSEDTPPNAFLYDLYEYDSTGRVVKHTTPWNKVTVTSYLFGLVSVFDPLDLLQRVETDGLGRPLSVTDAQKGVTTYAYGPFGALWEVTDPGGAVTRTERDAFGRVRTLTDPDRGVTHLHYNGFGFRTSMDDALGRTFSFEHDALGRTIRRIDVDAAGTWTTTWTWDTEPYGVGKLAKLTNAGSERRFTYDDHGRLHTTGLTVGGETFTKAITYDPLGRVDTLTYPTDGTVAPLVLQHHYDAHGHLLSVGDAATTYWSLTEVDGAGRPIAEAFGNGTVTKRAYHAESDRLQSIFTAKGAKKVQKLSYEYDERLNLASRSDGLQGRTEFFDYDQLDRLTCARFDDTPGGPGACEVSYEYAANGNITSRSDVGAYTYHPKRPHAVETAGTETYHHDDVGNQIARVNAQIGVDYTTFDLPRSITTEKGSIALEYDGAEQRIRRTVLAGGVFAVEETVYADDLYERVTHVPSGEVEHRYYVHSNERAVAIVTRRAGATDVTRYIHVDHLGSVDALTDESGALIERRSYDAFGARRNPAWGQPPPSPFASGTSRGFTGHEDEEALGLVNMKGRIYDPKVGRFMTPDPFVSRPHFGQSWNRYSYVLNGPLTYVDPSGFQEQYQAPPVDPEYANDPEVQRLQRESCRGLECGREAQEEANREGMRVGSSPVPVDVNTYGNTAPLVPEAPPERSTLGKVGEVGIGAAIGIGKFAWNIGKTLTLNALTFGGYSTFSIGRSLWNGYQQGGVLGAVNAVNPVHHVAAGAIATYHAANRGDYRAAGEAGATTVVLAATLVYGAAKSVGGATLAAEEGVAAEVAGAEAAAGEAPAAVGAAEVRMVSPRVLRATEPLSSKSQAAKMSKLMGGDKKFGPFDPIDAVESDGALYIKDGHHRRAAAIKARLSEVPVRVRPAASAEEAQQLFRDAASLLDDKGF